jgi:non-ribosomal peptide synthetase component F/predicted amino acid dehydrogenase
MPRLSERIRGLSPEARTLLEEQVAARAQRRSIAPTSGPPLERVPRDGLLPLSFAQERLWFLDRLDPNSTAFNMPGALRLTGPLDTEAVIRSFEEIVRRHEILRTTFETRDGEARQHVDDDLVIELPVVDLRARVESEQVLQAEMQAEVQRPFDLTKGPLIRSKLLRLADEEHVLLVTAHHIVFDGWSIGVFIRELGTLYAAFKLGKLSPLHELPVQYADYASWQRQWLQGETLERQLRYWESQLAGAPLTLDLPTDRPRPPVQSHRGARYGFRLDEELTQRLREFGRADEATLFMVLLTGFGVLLSRYSSQRDLVVGTSIANRPRAETVGLIGFFVNSLALRLDLSRNPNCRQLLRGVQKMALDAYAHQDVPVEKLIEELRPLRDLSRSQLFQVMLILQVPAASALTLPELTVDVLEGLGETSNFDLTLYVKESSAGLMCHWEYATDLFRRSTVGRMTAHFETLLRSMLDEPEADVFRLPIISEAERRAIVEWNKTATVVPTAVTVQEAFERRSQSTPDAIALVLGGHQLTYGELHRRANRLALRLRALGVRPEVLVGVTLERSLEVVLAVLAVLKAGGACAPIRPAQRVAEDATILLTQACGEDRFSTGATTVLSIGGELAKALEQPSPELAPMRSDLLAFALNTSGAAHDRIDFTHEPIVSLLTMMNERLGIRASETLLAVAPLSSDVTVFELCLALSCGSRVVFADEALCLDGAGLRVLVKTWGINWIHGVSATWRLLLEAGLSSSAGVRIIHSGPALPSRLADEVVGMSVEAWSVCNSMSAATWSTPVRIQTGVDVGAPTANAQLHVFDDQMQLAPLGIVGDLYVGGAAVPRGFHGLPELTAEYFVPGPSGLGRLYRPGYRARLRSEELSSNRVDHEARVCGLQIALGGDHLPPAESGAAGNGHGQTATEKRIIAYVVCKDTPVDGTELRDYLRQRLPEYMVPSAFVLLDALPLTPSGKVDRNALLAPDWTKAQKDYLAPRHPVEEIIARVWAEVLGLSRVGVHDNFFELGGHSLLATKAVARLAKALDVPALPVKSLFLAPTVATLARLLSEPTRAVKDIPEPSLQNMPKRREAPQGVNYSIESAPLSSLFIAGRLAPVHSASIGYLGGMRLPDMFHGLPLLLDVTTTALGRIATLLLPMRRQELYEDEKRTVEMVLTAIKMARQFGARVVSLTGLIPSATRYGEALTDAAAGIDVLITTGHATTASAVVISLREALFQGGRDLSDAHLAFVGLGSVGLGTMRLVFEALPHPKQVTLCDLHSKANTLRSIEGELRGYGFAGPIHRAEATGMLSVPDRVYNASIIVGATNVPDVVDVKKVAPGTIIVDDSAPHCFSVEEAIARLEKHSDILFTEGGLLRSPEPMTYEVYWPPEFGELPDDFTPPYEITGCTLSSLLSARFPDVPITIGSMRREDAIRHLAKLAELEYGACSLHCGNYRLPEEAIRAYRQRFG